MSELEEKTVDSEEAPDDHEKLDVEVSAVSLMSDEKGGVHIIPMEDGGEEDGLIYLNTFSIYTEELFINSGQFIEMSGKLKISSTEEIEIFINEEEGNVEETRLVIEE